MRCRLSNGAIAIVAAGAGGTGVGVIEGGRCPTTCLVAILTRVAGREMIGRFAAGRCAIVAAHTAARGTAVIKSRRIPAGCGVAGAAFLACGDMA